MSHLLPSLKASTSCLPVQVQYRAAASGIRHASSSSSTTKPKIAGAQAAEEEIATMRKQMAALKKNARSVDMTAMATPVLGALDVLSRKVLSHNQSCCSVR